MRIGTKAILVFSAFAVATVGVTGALLIRASRSSFEQAVTSRQLLLTQNRALAVRDNLDLATGELVRLSEMAEIDLGDGDLLHEQRLLEQAWRQSGFFNVSLELIDADGSCRWAAPAAARCAGTSYAKLPWFRDAIASASPVFAYVSEPDGTGIVHLIVQVHRRPSLNVGLLRGTVDLKHDRMLSPVLEQGLQPETRAILVASSGTTVYVRGGVDASRPPFGDAVASVIAGHSGARATGEGSGRQLAAWAPVGYGDLGLVFTWPWAALDDPAESQTRQLVLLVGLSALLALSLGYVVSKAMVRPILRLAGVTRAAQLDPVQQPLPATRADEIGDLERAFSQLFEQIAARDERIQRDMAEIAELASSLERRVEERTAELEQAQTALVAAERFAVIGEAGAALSHELRNSLNAISIGIDTMARESVQSAELAQIQRQVRNEIARLRALSDDLLSFAKDPRLRLDATNVRALIEAATALADEHARANSVELESHVARDLPAARLDGDRIQCALVNLLRNGIEAARASPNLPRQVRLEARREQDTIVLRISDSGDGVGPDVKLFKPFATTKRTGIGLGLAIADRFVRAHGGSIAVVCGELRGACFEVRLPLVAQAGVVEGTAA